jgi:exonuclease SbcC
MRPLRLDLHGFTVFRDPTTVDLTDADFFALVGPTGAGKSTVLDAICFALYGTVPRWGDRRRIENALAPSANEARVRLVFEAAGARFVATRVVRRDGKGRVSTSHAGLEQLPPGFDLRTLDLAPAQRDTELGEVLAGTPAEMEDAVLAAVGLPYEQFTSCVILPQGEFARFLHAKPKDRQDILVNLLGLHVYQRIGERAGLVARDAETKATTTRALLAELSGGADALADASALLDAARALAEKVERELPALAEAASVGENARAELSRVDTQLTALGAVRMPAAAAHVGEELIAARDAATAAEDAVTAAEEREEKARAERESAGDRTALTRLADAHEERAKLSDRVAGFEKARKATAKEHDRGAKALQTALAAAAKAAEALGAAQQHVEAAQTADRAGTLRQHLVEGEPCPVCEQTVSGVPAVKAPALAAARAQLGTAEKAAATAKQTVDAQDATLRELDRRLAAATAHHTESVARLAELDATLADAPPLKAVRSGLAAIATADRAVSDAAEAVRTCRAAAKTAATRLRGATDAVTRAWRDFDSVRDGLAPLGPPPADRDDLVSAWTALRSWAAGTASELTATRDRTLAAAETALSTLRERIETLEAVFADAGLRAPKPAGDPATYRQAAALAIQQATSAHERVLERQAQAEKLAEQVAAHERVAQVAKTLALHLRADRFERWLLAEALDALVVGASRILRELTSGQYDLCHDNGEFYVVDHSDADLRRGVRTLSGGETFQASLALALALSEQLAGLSTSAASLESIMLDEGFGTLDASTLDIVAATLENLASRGDRMVGVVTHVPALAERIPVRLEVSRDARGGAHITRTG